MTPVLGRRAAASSVSRLLRGGGDVDVGGAQVETNDAVVFADLVEGDGDDAGQLLAVEQDEAAGDPVAEFQFVVWRRRWTILQRVSSSRVGPSRRGRLVTAKSVRSLRSAAQSMKSAISGADRGPSSSQVSMSAWVHSARGRPRSSRKARKPIAAFRHVLARAVRVGGRLAARARWRAPRSTRQVV